MTVSSKLFVLLILLATFSLPVSCVEIDETISVGGDGVLFASTNAPHARDLAVGSGEQSYQRSLSLTNNSTSFEASYSMDSGNPAAGINRHEGVFGASRYHWGYSCDFVSKEAGVSHSLRLNDALNLSAQSSMSLDLADFEDDIALTGHGQLQTAILTQSGRHFTDASRFVSSGNVSYNARIFEIEPPSAGAEDWLDFCDFVPPWTEEAEEAEEAGDEVEEDDEITIE